jgi:hypothetical protein
MMCAEGVTISLTTVTAVSPQTVITLHPRGSLPLESYAVVSVAA